MELTEILKVYGPLGLGWLGFIYLGRWVLGAVFDWCEVVEKHQSERD